MALRGFLLLCSTFSLDWLLFVRMSVLNEIISMRDSLGVMHYRTPTPDPPALPGTSKDKPSWQTLMHTRMPYPVRDTQ